MSSLPTDLFGWIAVDQDAGAILCTTDNVGAAWATPSNVSSLCGDWPLRTCNAGMLDEYGLHSYCDFEQGPYILIGDFFWSAWLPCYSDVWLQRLDWSGDRCWTTVAHYESTLGWDTSYPILDFGVQPSTLYYYRLIARMFGAMIAQSIVLFVFTQPDCRDGASIPSGSGSSGSSGSGSGSSGSGSSGSGSSGSGSSGSGGGSSGGSGGGAVASQLFVACDTPPDGVPSELWLLPLTGDLAGLPPVAQASNWCYTPATPAQYRSDPPDVTPNGFFYTCAQCEQFVSTGGPSGGGGSSASNPGTNPNCPGCCNSFTVIITDSNGGFWGCNLGTAGVGCIWACSTGSDNVTLIGGAGGYVLELFLAGEGDAEAVFSIPSTNIGGAPGSFCPKSGTYTTTDSQTGTVSFSLTLINDCGGQVEGS